MDQVLCADGHRRGWGGASPWRVMVSGRKDTEITGIADTVTAAVEAGT